MTVHDSELLSEISLGRAVTFMYQLLLVRSDLVLSEIRILRFDLVLKVNSDSPLQYAFE